MPEDKINNKEDKGYTVVDKRVSSQHDSRTASDAGAAAGSPGIQDEKPPEKKIDEPVQQAQGPETQGGGSGQAGRDAAPPEVMTFTHVVLSFVASAYQYLEKEKNLSHAKQTIDALGILEEKTKGNLSKEEEELMKNVLFDLRMRYVEGTKK